MITPRLSVFVLCLAAFVNVPQDRQSDSAARRAFIDGTGPGWKTLVETDFAGVNGNADTWTWKGDILVSSGVPTGVLRTRQKYTNFELVVEWRHLKPAGNSGVFAWVPDQALAQLKPGVLPDYGIEVQMLDHGFRDQYEKSGRKGDWFTTHGDIFAVGKSKLTPFAPVSPNGSRSFPRKELSRGVGSGITTTCAGSTARCGCGSTAKRSPAAAAPTRTLAICVWRPKVRRSSSRTCGFASFPELALREGEPSLLALSGAASSRRIRGSMTDQRCPRSVELPSRGTRAVGPTSIGQDEKYFLAHPGFQAAT